MNVSALTNNKQTPPILIIDKVGIIGEAIARHFAKENLVVFLSERLYSKNSSNILHISFKKKIPQVPDNEYSKIFIVDDGSSVTRESAFSFVNKALENNAPLYFIGSVRNVDVEHADDIAKSYNHAKILLFGDLFDNGLVFDKTSTINKFINSVRSEQKIEVSGTGLSLNFPITFSDTIKLIIKATELELSQKIILLFSGTPITDLALAKEFKNVNPLIKIDFSKAEKNKKIYIPTGSMHALEKYELRSRIESLSLGRVNKNVEKKKKINKDKKFKLRYVLILLFLILFAPLTYTYLLLFAGNILLEQGYKAISENKLNDAAKVFNYSSQLFSLSDSTRKALSIEVGLVRQGGLAHDANKKTSVGKYLSSGGVEITNSLLGFERIFRGRDERPLDTFNSSLSLYSNGISDIEKSLALNKPPLHTSTIFNNTRFVSDAFANSPESLLNFLGFESEKKYLVLILDKNYINPIGGKIVGLKIIHVNNGRITKSVDSKTDKFNNYDDKPLEIPLLAKRYMQIDKPTLSDSVYKNNFNEDAKDIKAFYESSNSEPIDGIIALDKDELESLGRGSLIDSLTLFGSLIKNKKIIIASTDDQLQKIFSSSGWGGGIYDNRQKTQNSVNDYFGVVETNVDNSASNNYISKTISKRLIIDSEGQVSSSATIAVKNSNKSTYKAYLQLLLPSSSSIIDIRINGVSQKIAKAVADDKVYKAKNFQPPAGLEVNEVNNNDKKIEGFLIEVPPDGTKTIGISYKINQENSSSSSLINYSLGVYKQPGIDSYTMNLVFEIPSSYQVIGSVPAADLLIDGDKSVSASFSQK